MVANSRSKPRQRIKSSANFCWYCEWNDSLEHLKRPGAMKGIRLIHFDSLMAYIESLEE
jgi:hypothetical protein